MKVTIKAKEMNVRQTEVTTIIDNKDVETLKHDKENDCLYFDNIKLKHASDYEIIIEL